MKKFEITLKDLNKNIYSDHIKFNGQNLDGDKISFTNYYMEINNKKMSLDELVKEYNRQGEQRLSNGN